MRDKPQNRRIISRFCELKTSRKQNCVCFPFEGKSLRTDEIARLSGIFIFHIISAGVSANIRL